MAELKDLLQMIAGKEIQIFDLKEALAKCQNSNKALATELDALKSKPRAKGNGKHDDAITDESTQPTGSK